jgi:hypothetical protein
MIAHEGVPGLRARPALVPLPAGMYLRTVRGETRIPSFTSSSEAMRSSPHERFAAAMSAINRRRSADNWGRPRGNDFHRQNSRKPFRCHRMSVSGLTTLRTRRQSISRDSARSVIRVASSARRGLIWRSRYNANCLRRKNSRRRVGCVAATWTPRIGGRRRRRVQSYARGVENRALPCRGLLPPRTLVQIDRRHEGKLHDPFRPRQSRTEIWPEFVRIHFLRTTSLVAAKHASWRGWRAR